MSDTLKEQLEALLQGEESPPKDDAAAPVEAGEEVVEAEAPPVEDSPFAALADLMTPQPEATEEEATEDEATEDEATEEATPPQGETVEAQSDAEPEGEETPEASSSSAATVPKAAAEPAAEATPEESQESPVAVKTLSPYDLPGSWFVVHSYSGYENKVKANLESRIKSMHMEDQIFDVMIPMEDVVEFKGGRKVTVPKKVFPGYILVRLYMDEDAWFVVRNTPGVTGFVGSGTKPTPLSRREVERILGVDKPDEEKKAPRFKPDWEVGETVRVVEGPFADFNGMIEDINVDQSKVRVLVDIFGRETPVELSFEQIQKY